MICLSSYSPIPSLHAVVLILIFTTISASYGDGNKTDHQALLHIKSRITQDPYGALTSWNDSLHFCEWSGVTCGKRHRRVTYLGLGSQRLEGSLSPHVGNLSFLRVLSLVNNSFQGAIPHELGYLSRLRFLNLGRNKFNGVIPASISRCSNLEHILLSYNELVGSIPKEVSFLSKLTVLSLSNNNLTSGIPSFLGNITSMEVFSISRNPLSGRIPDTLGHWKKLKEIYCEACNLYGNIPKSLYNLSFLTNISLAENQLSGSLPPAIGEMLPRLIRFQLWGNQLTGSLPPSTSNCSSLRYIDISQNMLSGKLIINFAKLRDIQAIYLNGNNFGSEEANEMKFIDSLENCTRLEMLDLGNCKFQGVIPTSIGNISNQLSYLSLYKNQLHGNLPRSIGNLVGLEMLSLEGNQLIGNIPSTIGNLQRLQLVSLNANQISGSVPNAIGNLSLLIELDLSSNKLQGVIPSSLGNCHNLLALDLSKNKLNGKIPIQLLQLSSLSIYLDLSQNNLFGTLPTEVGNLKMLSVLDLSDNNLSGSIPSSLGDCVSLTRLSLKGNLFQGIIPPSLSNLRGLGKLDISHNNLSGQIPKFLEHFPSNYINLSFNDFEGEVEFPNASVFDVMGNSRLCSGLVELRLPKCKFKEIKKHTKKFHVFVVVILIASILFTAICLANALCKKRSMVEPSQSSMSNRFLKVSYKQLLKATNGFSEANLIGNGGSSSVYIGILDEYDDRYVAIKVLHLQNRGAQKCFTRECEVWQNIRHRNLLKIITSCSSIDFHGNDFKALVYELMPNGGLHDWLNLSATTSRLSLIQIVNILIDVASALEYLHNQCVPAVVHGDLKPSNILLDEDMVAHIGDFGLAKLIGTTSYQNTSTTITGTIGYVAPEYGLGNELTSSGDVYSFGILLLEVLTGKKPTDDTFKDGLSLHRFASTAFPEHVTDIIDVNILDVFRKDETLIMQNKEANVKEIEECLVSLVKIGVSCSMDSPTQRMDMKMVIHALQHILDRLQNTCYFQITCTFFQE